MACTETEPQLNALADHELSPGQAWRIRRHLAACPACAAQLAAIQNLDATVRAWQDVPAPSALGTRIAAALPPVLSPVPHRAFPVRPAAVGFMGLAAAVAAVFWFLPGQPGQPTIAFADVQRAMQQVQTVSWTETLVYHDGMDRPVERSLYRSHHWLRRVQPALASVGHFQDKQSIQELEDTRGSFERLAPGIYTASRSGDIAEAVHNALQEITEPSFGTGSVGFQGSTRVKTSFSMAHQQYTMLGSKRLILFTHVQEVIAARRRATPDHYFTSVEMWADPVTDRVVRIETREGKGPTAGINGMVITQSDFSYNLPPPPGIFDWSVPAGAKILTGQQALDAGFYFIRHPAATSRRRHEQARRQE